MIRVGPVPVAPLEARREVEEVAEEEVGGIAVTDEEEVAAIASAEVEDGT